MSAELRYRLEEKTVPAAPTCPGGLKVTLPSPIPLPNAPRPSTVTLTAPSVVAGIPFASVFVTGVQASWMFWMFTPTTAFEEPPFPSVIA